MAIFSDFPIFDFKTYKDKEHKSEYSLMTEISHKPHTMLFNVLFSWTLVMVLIKHVLTALHLSNKQTPSLLLKI